MKQTTKSIIPEDWQQKSFSECVEKTSIPRQIKIPQGQYQKAGEYPIVDQGADFIAGYTNDQSKLYSGQLPVIVFGDHTRIFKYVDFAFSLGADGTKLLCPKKFLNPQYFYYYLSGLSLESKGYNRHYKYLKEKLISFPEMLEQRKISHILLNIKNAIEQQEKIIAKTKELKRSLMHRLFTYGLRGEELKETEIGKMPKGWKLTSIGQAYKFTTKPRGLDLSKHKEIPFIPMEIISENQRLLNKYEMRKKFSSGTYVQKGDLVVAKITPSFENGKQGIVTDIPLSFCYATTEVWPLHGVNGYSNIEYLHYYLKKPGVRNEIAGKMEGSTGRQRVSKNVIAETKIPLPPYKEQVEISDIFISLDQKVDVGESRKKSLSLLFNSLLHLLMTGQVRVKDIDFGETNV